MEEEKFQIRVDGPGIAIQRTVPQDIAQRICMIIFSAAGQANAQKDGDAMLAAALSSQGEIKPADPQDYLVKSDAKRSLDKIVALSVYLKEIEKKESFNKQDLIRVFEEASEKVPGNLSRDIWWATQAKWIASRHGQRNLYYLTSDGQEAFRGKFGPIWKKKSKQPGTNREGDGVADE